MRGLLSGELSNNWISRRDISLSLNKFKSTIMISDRVSTRDKQFTFKELRALLTLKLHLLHHLDIIRALSDEWILSGCKRRCFILRGSLTLLEFEELVQVTF